MNLPTTIDSEEQLDEVLSRPTPQLVEAVRTLRGPLLVLGASGKMGPSLCLLARRAAEQAGHDLRVIAVSRFSQTGSSTPAAQRWLESHGIETTPCDLLERQSLASLPDSENVIYLVGLKFGTRQNPALTWAVNTLVPAHVAERFPGARLVALSTGNVYPFVTTGSGGATEEHAPNPVGEYGSAALARERIFEYFSRRQATRTALLRLNYAVELRYGVLLDIAEKVWNEEALDLSTGHLNCIWQRDANEMILRSLALASHPPVLFNLTGPVTLSVRELAGQFALLLGREPKMEGTEAETALLSNATRLCSILGPPVTPLQQVLRWIAHWVKTGGPTLKKPTHFEVRSGEF